VIERRTLIRRRADSARADVLRGERSQFKGEVVEVPEGYENRDFYSWDRERAEDAVDVEAKSDAS
jgi:hypothetical protein